MSTLNPVIALFAIALTTMFFPNTALANMLGYNPPIWSVVGFITITTLIGISYYIFFVLLNAVVEFVVFYLTMKNYILSKEQVLFAYGVANFISYLPTILTFALSGTYYLFVLKALDPHGLVVTKKDLIVPIILAEMVAITIETILLSISFTRLYKMRYLNARIPVRKILKITVVANLVSLAFSPMLWSFR